MASSNSKLITAAIVAMILLGGIGVILWNVLSGPGRSTRQVHVDPAAVAPPANNFVNANQPPPVPAKPESEWLPKFKSIYALADGQTLKRIPTPFIAERLEFYRARMYTGQVQAIPRGPDFYLLDFDGNDFKMRLARFGQSDVSGLISAALGVDRTMMIGPPEILHLRLDGDLVVRKDSTAEQNHAALAAMLSEAIGKKLKIELVEMPRQALIVSGEIDYRGPATARATSPADTGRSIYSSATTRPTAPRIVISVGPPRADGYTRTATSDRFFQELQRLWGIPVLPAASLNGKRISWQIDNSAYRARGLSSEGDATFIDAMIASISEQSKMTFKREERPIKTWVISEESATSLPSTTAPLR